MSDGSDGCGCKFQHHEDPSCSKHVPHAGKLCDRCGRKRDKGVLCVECKELLSLRAWRQLVCGNLETMMKDPVIREYHGHFSSILAATDWSVYGKKPTACCIFCHHDFLMDDMIRATKELERPTGIVTGFACVGCAAKEIEGGP